MKGPIKNATYDQNYLQSLTRSQLQQLAKSHKLKATGKTTDIIMRLVGKEVLPEDAARSKSSPRRSPRKALRSIHNNFERRKGVPEKESENAEHQRQTSPVPLSQLRSQPIAPSSGKARRTKTVYRAGTPYPPTKPLPSNESGSVSPEEEISQGAALPNAPTLHDVRVVRRRLTTLIKEQQAFEESMMTLKTILQTAEASIHSAATSVESLAWQRTSIEVRMGRWKNDRHLWDGTAQMEEEDATRWREYCRKNANPNPTIWTIWPRDLERAAPNPTPPSLQPHAAQTHSTDAEFQSQADQDMDIQSAEEAEEASVLLSVGVLGEDDPDDIYA